MNVGVGRKRPMTENQTRKDRDQKDRSTYRVANFIEFDKFGHYFLVTE
jgi:hypothetical protein